MRGACNAAPARGSAAGERSHAKGLAQRLGVFMDATANYRDAMEAADTERLRRERAKTELINAMQVAGAQRFITDAGQLIELVAEGDEVVIHDVLRIGAGTRAILPDGGARRG